MFPTRGADKKAALLAQAKADRLTRSGQKKQAQDTELQEKAVLRIQACWRRYWNIRKTKDVARKDWDFLSEQLPPTPAQGLVRNLQLVFLLLRFYDAAPHTGDSKRLHALCKILLSKTISTATAGSTSPNPENSPSSDKKPVMQIPFQMILLHSRFADQAASLISQLMQLCLRVMVGNQEFADAPEKTAISRSHSSGWSTNGSNTFSRQRTGSAQKSRPEGDLYLSGPELRFFMAFVDINTFKLPESVSQAIRTQMTDKGTALIIKTLNSGQFYKSVKIGIRARAEAIVQLQERARRTLLVPDEQSKLKAMTLWVTALWRCCFLLQAVDKEASLAKAQADASSKKSAAQHKGNLINLYSDDSTIVGITCHILTVPLLVDCLDDLCVQLAWKGHVLLDVLDSVLDVRHQEFILSCTSLNETLFLLGNLTKLYRLCLPKNMDSVNTLLKTRLVEVAVVLLTHCQKYVSGTQTTEFRQYHPIFSWTNLSQKDQQMPSLQVKLLLLQLEYLWSRDFALGTFRTLLNRPYKPVATVSAINSPPTSASAEFNVVSPSSLPPSSRHVRDASGTADAPPSDPQGTLLALEVQQACLFYMTLMRSFESQKSRILVTLMYLPKLLTQIWRFMTTLGPKGEMHIYLEAASGSGQKGLEQEPLIAILQLFCECCARFFITLDDDDMYEQQKPWELSELVFMSGFFNQFCFAVLSQQEDPRSEAEIKAAAAQSAGDAAIAVQTPLPPIFYHARQVLMQLYERDCRRAFCPPNHWLLLHPTKGVFQSPLQLLASLTLSSRQKNSTSQSSGAGSNKKGNGFFSFSSRSPPQYATPKEFIQRVSQKDRTALQILETMPHVIPFSARLEIFRDFIKEEKVQRGQNLALVRPDLHQSVMVKVRRGYVLEDGYQNLGQLSANQWKNTIRVKFVNEVGADEAGIDQGGPFKEFMEGFLESGFSPNLNLFTTTTASMNLLYPSPTSHYTHPSIGLELFKLFGKMLGKAMYEGLLIEVKFAGFFLSKILGRTVFLDEMRSFDEEVFRNLMFLKKYDGDVEDLGLTFSLDEDIFGTHKTIELMGGGKDIEVTKENRINYIFQVSDYRLNKQIQDQSRAFIDGFRSIIPLPWISIFSPQELHRVMAGDDVDFDVQDLRAHTEYQNGYFDQHPVIRNLWAALNEFNSEEKRAFLKFVTSCSKPPLGGFKHLHPPFSIRLVMNPTTTDTNHDGTPNPPPRQFGSGAQTNTLSSSSTSSSASSRSQNASGTGSQGRGLGSRFRSAFSSGSNSQGSSTSAGTSSNTVSSSTSSRSNSSSPFALTTDEHGTPAALGVVKSFFGGVLGGSGGSGSSSESAGKKARLPTSSTCFNLLKLPPFNSKSVLKEKLRYAIMSNTGFELS